MVHKKINNYRYLGKSERWIHFQSVTALGKYLSPEEIKRGGTGYTTNKAFDRYFQPQKEEHIKVITAIKKLKDEARGEVIELNQMKEKEK